MSGRRKGEHKITSREEIVDLSRAFQRSRTLLTAVELDVFTVLDAGPKTSEEMAREIQAGERETDRLLNALCALGLAEKSGHLFSNSPLAARFLVRGKADHIAGLLHSASQWKTWSTLTETIKTGHAPLAKQVRKARGPRIRSFVAAMHQRGMENAEKIASLIDFDGVKRVLDVGGGSGSYSQAFVRAGRDIQAVVFDLPNVIPLTKEYIAAAGLQGRIETQVGDYSTDDLGQGYDLIFLSAIVHINSPEQNEELIRKCARALNPGGQVVIQDLVMDENRTSPYRGTMFALNMLVNTAQGDTYTESEIREWMTNAGMSFVERQDFAATGLMIGRKEQSRSIGNHT